MSIKLIIHGHLFVVVLLLFFSVKRRLCSCLKKAWGLLALLMLNFAGLSLTRLFIEISVRFHFHLLINIYVWKLI